MFDPRREIWIDRDLTIKYYSEGRYIMHDTTFLKKRKLNNTGENLYLNSDCSIERDEDKIIAAQRLWLHNAYKPDGLMYRVKKEKIEWTKDGTCSGSNS
jgi:hypothetical protein